jgi:regulator of sirC expression with transglutaminase-like and TPR domain
MMTSRQFIDFDGYLKSVSDCSDADFPFMDVALHLAEIDRPGLSVDRYRHELDRYAARARVLYDQMAGQDPRGQVYDQYNTLLQLIVNEEQYKGDDQTYDHIDNTDITRVMDRRVGIPVALGLFMPLSQKACILILRVLIFLDILFFACRQMASGFCLILLVTGASWRRLICGNGLNVWRGLEPSFGRIITAPCPIAGC